MFAYLTHPMTWICFGIGLCVGSFLNVCILRIPDGNFFAQARSYCPNCKKIIPWYLNIPVLSFVILRGKSRCCRTNISWQYPMVEICTACLTVLCYWYAPFVRMVAGHFASVDPLAMIRFTHVAIFTYVLIICSVVDLRLMIIPDVLSLPMIGFVPLVVWLHPELDAVSATLGVLGGGGILYAIAWIYWLVRREIGLGMGDVKLLAMIGGWLGVQALLPTLLCASISGSLFGIAMLLASRQKNLKTALPFGPFLAAGALIHVFGGSILREWLLRFGRI